jgi:signal transduction histidine kinase
VVTTRSAAAGYPRAVRRWTVDATVAAGVAAAGLAVDVEQEGEGLLLAAGPGNDIIGMTERAHALGGSLRAGPRPEGGFRVRACLPLAEEAS